jgi:predicted nucleic acid-binding protein
VYGDSESHRNVPVNFSSNSPPLISHCAAPALSAFAELSLLATRYQLTAYDTAYLGLARQLALPLATLDEDLKKAAGRRTEYSMNWTEPQK